MIDNILMLEARALTFVMQNLPDAGIILVDQAAAFPTLSRHFLLWVLRKMRVPRFFRRLIKLLYSSGIAIICIKNRLYFSFSPSSGVKQGDPSAMVLFVLSFDPILRFIANRISVFDAYPFAYCDDLGIATPVLACTWRVLMQIFVIVKKISSLCINIRKIMF